MIPPINGEITQLAAIAPSLSQFAISQPPAAIPAPSTPPTIECVVDTGAPNAVAIFNQIAPASKAAIMTQIKVSLFGIASGLMMPFLMVLTTSPPASKAPAASNITAIIIAPTSVNALDPTAGPTLFATSFAPIFIAIYPPIMAAMTNIICPGVSGTIPSVNNIVPTMNSNAVPRRNNSLRDSSVASSICVTLDSFMIPYLQRI